MRALPQGPAFVGSLPLAGRNGTLLQDAIVKALAGYQG